MSSLYEEHLMGLVMHHLFRASLREDVQFALLPAHLARGLLFEFDAVFLNYRDLLGGQQAFLLNFSRPSLSKEAGLVHHLEVVWQKVKVFSPIWPAVCSLNHQRTLGLVLISCPSLVANIEVLIAAVAA